MTYSRAVCRAFTFTASAAVMVLRSRHALGTHSRYRVKAERLACLAAASWSYDVSSERPEDFCGLTIADTAICEIS